MKSLIKRDFDKLERKARRLSEQPDSDTQMIRTMSSGGDPMNYAEAMRSPHREYWRKACMNQDIIKASQARYIEELAMEFK
ncbi:hypothetical protein TYRP_016813, partial [Tyrophagus putrescentiae]